MTTCQWSKTICPIFANAILAKETQLIARNCHTAQGLAFILDADQAMSCRSHSCDGTKKRLYYRLSTCLAVYDTTLRLLLENFAEF